MKKLFLAMLVLSSLLLLAACNLQGDGTQAAAKPGEDRADAAQSGQTTQAQYDWSVPQVVYQRGGKIHFHDPASGRQRILEEETGEVFNLVFDPRRQTLYYTVVQDGMLGLRKATLSDGKLKLQTLKGLELEKDAFVADIHGEYSELQLVGEKLVLMGGFNYDVYNFSQYNIYSPQDDAWISADSTANIRDLLDGMEPWDMDARQPFETRNQQLFYTGAGKPVAVGNQLQLALDPEHGEEEISYFGLMVSPDGDKVAFNAVLEIVDLAHGPLCIANADGSGQRILSKDGMSRLWSSPQWLGSQLVFLDQFEEGRLAEGEGEGQGRLMISQGSDNAVKLLAEKVRGFTVIPGEG